MAETKSDRLNLTILLATLLFTALGVVYTCRGASYTHRQLQIPHDNFPPELQKEYTAKLRQYYQGDLRLDATETEQLDKFLDNHHIPRFSAEEIRRDLVTRIEGAARNINLGRQLARQRRFNDARREFLSATEFDKENPAAWADLAAANMELGKTDEGRKAYDQALILAPADWRIHYNFGLFFLRTKNPEAALKQLQQALSPYKGETGLSDSALRTIIKDLKTNPLFDLLRGDPRFKDLETQLDNAH